jgi:ketosteroid isomerase-like protein
MASPVTTDPALQLLLDKQEIHEVIMRYCRAIDRCDEELLRSVYHSDAWDDHGQFKGKASDFIPVCMKALRDDFHGTMHAICNELVEIEGDTAYSESYFVAYHRANKDGVEHELVLGGRYVDRFERRQGVWKIAHRVVAHEFDTIEPAKPGFWRPNPFVIGLRSREDIVYRR